MNTEKTDETQDLPVMISDAAWQSILSFLKASTNVYVGNPENCRRFLSETIVWITKQGATWRALPKVYGYWNSIYRRFGRWCDAGVFEKLMAKTEVEVQFKFTLPIDECFLQHKSDAERKAKEAFVLELLRHGDISTGRAAKLLDISRWDLSDLMSEAGISPFAELTAEELDAEVEAALKVLDS